MNPEITPERLDALLDGSASPETDVERDMLHLAAQMRDEAPRAGNALRERVQALGDQMPRPRPARRWWPASAPGRWRVVVPALSAVAAAIISVGVLTNGGNDNASQDASNAAGSAVRESRPGAATRDASTPKAPSADEQATTAPPSAPAATDRNNYASIGALNAAATEVVIGTLREGGRELARSSDNSVINVAAPFSVTRVVRGTVAPGATIEIEQPKNADGSRFRAADGPAALEPGREYLLFLRPNPDASFYFVLFDEGTWEVVDGRIQVVGESILTDSSRVQGRTVDEAVAAIESTPATELDPPTSP